MSFRPSTGLLAAAACAAAVASCAREEPGPVAAEVPWNARTAEHLFNRAGFGATPEEIAAAVAAGLEATVEGLLEGPERSRPDGSRGPARLRGGVPAPAVLADGPESLERPILAHLPEFYADGGQLRQVEEAREFCSRWIGRMLAGEDPLRERMALFWHGHFVSSTEEVEEAGAVVRQVEFLREHALGDFGTLVRGIARDPAMLEYLNNDVNVKGSPNENWARELLELFTLGEGNYGEDDVKEVARAFSGWTRSHGAFALARADHDLGAKTVLGVTGILDGDDVIDLVLEHEACARYLASELIEYFEGVPPAPRRLEAYAAHLRGGGYRIDAFLRRLFLDPAFYREEARGQRIAAPVEYFAGTARRLGCEVPPDVLYVAAALCGQRLLAPPNVKGWEQGLAWLTTSHVMQRGNLAGILVGELDRELRPGEVLQELIESRGREFGGPYRDYLALTAWLQAVDWRVALPPARELVDVPAGPAGDGALVEALLERLLPVPSAPGTHAELVRLARGWRAELGLEDASLLDLDGAGARELLRRLVHVILSLPEAQLV